MWESPKASPGINNYWPSLQRPSVADFRDSVATCQDRELWEACRSGNLNRVRELISIHGNSINARDADGRRSTPLHFAAGFGRKEVVEYLLETGGDVGATDEGGLISLHNACSFGHADVVRMLIEAKSDVNTQDRWGWTSLHEAAIKGKADVCILLLQAGADWNVSNSDGKMPLEVAEGPARLVLKDGRKSSPLHLAAGYNRVRIVEILLKQSCFTGRHWPMADVLAKDKGGLVPLHNACSYGHIDVVNILLKAGADPNTCDLWQFTPLHEASNKGRHEVCSLLIAYGADPHLNNCHGKNSIECAASKELADKILREYSFIELIDACKQGNISRMKKLLTPELINFAHIVSGETPLMIAVTCPFAKRRQVVESLLKKGAGVQIQSKDGSTALHYAATFGHIDAAELLVRHNAQMSIKDCVGDTPLHRAVKHQHAGIYHLFISNGGDPNIQNNDGLTPIDLGSQALPSHSINLPSNDSNKVFLEAAKSGDLDQVKRLCNPSTVNCRDVEGRHSTPFTLQPVIIEFKSSNIFLVKVQSYGHYDVVVILVQAGANVNTADLWKYTPVHEAASKGKYDICKLLMKNGADPNKKNRDGQSPLDVAKDSDIKDILLGDAAVLDAAKSGSVARIQKLLTAENVNCRDTHGRNSTPLHLAAGYNNIEVAEILIEYGADVNAEDRGGLIPLHNAASYGHVEIAQVLLKHGSHVNANDRWQFTPLHEAAQKGRTQLCALLLSHGADPYVKNQEGQTTIEVASQDDVRCLLRDAMWQGEPNQTPESQRESTEDKDPPSQTLAANLEAMKNFLAGTEFEKYIALFEQEEITLDVLAEISHDELKNLGIKAYGHRHRLLRAVRKQCSGPDSSIIQANQPVVTLQDLDEEMAEYQSVYDEMQQTIREHKDFGAAGGIYQSFKICSIQKVKNPRLWIRYERRKDEVKEENYGSANERMLFHGSPFIQAIIQKGFDERHAYIGGMFGAGIYFAENSSKSNQYVWGIGGGTGCHEHRDKSCYVCKRQMLLCRVTLGKSFLQTNAQKLAHAPPGHHSVVGKPSIGGLCHPEYVIYRGEQSYPEYLITYLIQPQET
ncbi:Oidioi.mRNA.OKI2018_I69.XSR.g15365.t1.cds [Oikopleura dioica]|uniref:Poly [ADP-ribose] polymerase n=1 Tax=Oikopleura dioica TaxID=34765 RepID=A0ABN7SHQ4_OIKDI|nr:Oidioi.mRNA.OKI2018_I69.XSR.g15365.t1.cds [Oikopleura dioica]